MKETYLVCHCGKTKKFQEKSKALENAIALENLGYQVDVYLEVRTLFVTTKTLIYTANLDAFKRSFEKWQEQNQ